MKNKHTHYKNKHIDITKKKVVKNNTTFNNEKAMSKAAFPGMISCFILSQLQFVSSF